MDVLDYAAKFIELSCFASNIVKCEILRATNYTGNHTSYILNRNYEEFREKFCL